MEVLSMKECLKKMDDGEVFSVKWVTYNRQKKTGGRLEECLEARLKQKSFRKPTPETEAKIAERNKHRKTKYASDWTLKNPQHRKWFTRNIEVMFDGHATGQILKLHPPLIIEFNGKTVTP